MHLRSSQEVRRADTQEGRREERMGGAHWCGIQEGSAEAELAFIKATPRIAKA